MKNQKVVLITGVSRGIGKACAQMFKDLGYAVAGCARKREDATHEYVDLPIAANVAKPEDVDRMLVEFKKKFDRCDVILNNAGLANTCNLNAKESDDAWLDIIGVNLNGPYFVCKRFLPLIPKGGRIINISSVLGLRAVPGSASYCASKFGVIGFTKSLSLQLAKRQITVNAICPGWVDTDMAKDRLGEIKVDPKDAAAQVPMGRFLEGREIADCVKFLCSPSADMITGESLRIDGGSFV